MIHGTDEAGVEWEGAVYLDVDDDGNVTGTIDWTSSASYHGTETVQGELDDDGNLTLRGISVTDGGIVPCSYEGSWIDGEIDIAWVGHCPSGNASGNDDEEKDDSDNDDGEEKNDSDYDTE